MEQELTMEELIALINSQKGDFVITAAMRRAMELLSDKEALRTMSENLEKLARPDAAERIVDEIEKVMK